MGRGVAGKAPVLKDLAREPIAVFIVKRERIVTPLSNIGSHAFAAIGPEQGKSTIFRSSIYRLPDFFHTFCIVD